ncbi:MAG: 4a-hydroxytetrahydrobiopterin dehydratase [Candidatus Zixiibacteriota bacterium]
MTDLARKKCEPCEGGVDPLDRVGFSQYLEHIPDWSTVDDKMIEREFVFDNFGNALAFVNAAGAIAEEEGHHPNLFLHSWNKVVVSLFTHAIGGLSINDFIVAVKIDRIPR